jgi:hypothetical protein
MMDVRKHVDIRLVTNVVKLKKLISKPNFDRATVFTENLVAVHMKKLRSNCFNQFMLG